MRSRSKSSQSSGRRYSGAARSTRPTSRSGGCSGTPAQTARFVEHPRRAPEAPCRARLPSRREAPRTRRSGRSLSISLQKSLRILQAGRRAGCRRPVPARGDGRAPRPPSLTSSSPPGASTTSAKALTIRSPSGGASGPGAAQRFGEAQPFGAIIVAMLEQMLGELDLEPAARPGARDQHHRADRHHRKHADHQRRRPVDARPAQRGGDDRHQREIGADREQRERLEGRRARQADPPAALVARAASANSGAVECNRKPAPLDQRSRGRRAEIGDRVEVEVVDPHPGQAEHRQADVRPARRRRLAVDVVDEHQRACRGGDPAGSGWSGRARRSATCRHRAIAPISCIPITAGDRAIDQPHAVLPLVARCGQAVEQADPHEVAGAFGIADERIARRDRREPGPAGGHGERASEQALRRLARGVAAAARATATRTAPRRAHGSRR